MSSLCCLMCLGAAARYDGKFGTALEPRRLALLHTGWFVRAHADGRCLLDDRKPYLGDGKRVSSLATDWAALAQLR